MCRLAVAAVQKADPRTGSQHPAAIGGSNGQWRAFVQIFQPPPVTFGRMIEANEKHRTNHPAFVFGDAVLTHGEFAKRARTLSSALYRVGCRKKDRVAHLTKNRIEQCEIYGSRKSDVEEKSV